MPEGRMIRAGQNRRAFFEIIRCLQPHSCYPNVFAAKEAVKFFDLCHRIFKG